MIVIDISIKELISGTMAIMFRVYDIILFSEKSFRYINIQGIHVQAVPFEILPLWITKSLHLS